jgi:hypothetical protein
MVVLRPSSTCATQETFAAMAQTIDTVCQALPESDMSKWFAKGQVRIDRVTFIREHGILGSNKCSPPFGNR